MEKELVDELLYSNFHLFKLKMEEEYDQLLKDRDDLRYNVFKGCDNKLKGHFPVNI